MARHISDGSRRGLAPWVIVTAVAVVVIACATTAYLLIVNGSDDEANAACTGQVVLPITTSVGATSAIRSAAAGFDATSPSARSTCVTTEVTEMPGDQAVLALSSNWLTGPGPAPSVWAPTSAADLTALEATSSAMTAGRDPDPMAGSPVVLAVRAQDGQALSSLTWTSLPTAAGPAGTAVLPAGDHLILALPEPVANRATSYALQSVLATGATPVDAAAVTAAAAQLDALAKAGPPIQPATTNDALTQLAGGQGRFTAVPVVESELAAFSATNPGAELVAVHPAGLTVGDELYGAAITAQWTTPTLREAAAGFLAYLRSPAGQQFLVDNDLRVSAGTAATVTTPADAPDVSTAVESLPDGGPAVATALARAIGAAPTTG